MVVQIYLIELQLNKAYSSDSEAPFLNLNLSILNGIVSYKIYDKRDDFNFEIVNFPFIDGDTAKYLKQGYKCHKIRKAFSKFYHRYSELIVKYNIGLKLFCNLAYQNLYLMVI